MFLWGQPADWNIQVLFSLLFNGELNQTRCRYQTIFHCLSVQSKASESVSHQPWGYWPSWRTETPPIRHRGHAGAVRAAAPHSSCKTAICLKKKSHLGQGCAHTGKKKIKGNHVTTAQSCCNINVALCKSTTFHFVFVFFNSAPQWVSHCTLQLTQMCQSFLYHIVALWAPGAHHSCECLFGNMIWIWMCCATLLLCIFQLISEEITVGMCALPGPATHSFLHQLKSKHYMSVTGVWHIFQVKLTRR